jgi:hypothetical protein
MNVSWPQCMDKDGIGGFFISNLIKFKIGDCNSLSVLMTCYVKGENFLFFKNWSSLAVIEEGLEGVKNLFVQTI